MLKLGVPPTYAVTAVEINGKTSYSVGEDCLLLVCLAPDVRPEDVERMAEYAPRQGHYLPGLLRRRYRDGQRLLYFT